MLMNCPIYFPFYSPFFDQTRGYEIDGIDSFLNTEVFKNQQDARSAKGAGVIQR